MNDKNFIDDLLQREVQAFILAHAQDDPNQLVLKYDQVNHVPIGDVVSQINGRQKAKYKLPTLFNTPEILYPPQVNLEQCSSEATALFKSQLITGKRAADLTGGLGIDSWFFAKNFEQVVYVEPDLKLLQLAKHNHFVLGAGNIIHHNSAAENFLNHLHDEFDLVYLDPSRRVEGRRLVKLEDYSPNVIELLPALLQASENMLIKVSPLLDIQLALTALHHVANVYVVAVENECKELLFHSTALPTDEEPPITAVDLQVDGTVKEFFSFRFSEERNSKVNFSKPLKYLYEPNASILKAGAFKSVAEKMEVKKIAPSTHFYTSDSLVKNFPGRIFEIIANIKPDPKTLKHLLPDQKANVITRNYPVGAEELRKKLRLRDGGDKFVVACSGERDRFVLLASRLK